MYETADAHNQKITGKIDIRNSQVEKPKLYRCKCRCGNKFWHPDKYYDLCPACVFENFFDDKND